MRLLRAHHHHATGCARRILARLLGRSDLIGNASRPGDPEVVTVFLLEVGQDEAEILWVPCRRLAIVCWVGGGDEWITCERLSDVVERVRDDRAFSAR